MIRRLARAGLTLCLLLSLCATGLAAWQIAHRPGIAPFVLRGQAEIVAATDRLMATEATPARLGALVARRLAEDPRNWIAIDALTEVAAERAVALPPDLIAARDAARATDDGWAHRTAACAACAYDPAVCSLSNVMICQVPVALTPLGDIAGLARAGSAYATGGDVDEIDLGLSLVGLAATGLVLASGGSSALVKAGAGTAKLARRMGLLSPRLTALGVDAARRGIDWAALPAARSAEDLTRLIRADAFAPVVATATDLGRIEGAVGLPRALHLLGYVDDAADARRLARATEALGPRTIGRIEVLGKARLMRATLRWSEAARAVIAGLCGLVGSLAALIGGAVQGGALRMMRRLAR